MRNQLPATSDLLSVFDQTLVKSAMCVGVIGSRAEQLDSSTSDIDLVAFIPEEKINDIKSNTYITASHGGKRVDLLVLTIPGFNSIISTPSQTSPEDTPLQRLELIHKVVHAVPLFGEDFYSELISTFHYGHFARTLIRWYSLASLDGYDDLVGIVEDGHMVAGAASVRHIIRLGMDALLAARGDTYPKPKWRVRRAERALGVNSPIYLKYLDIEFHAPDKEMDKLESWILDVLAFNRRLQLECFFPNEIAQATEDCEHEASDPLVYIHPWANVFENLDQFYVKCKSQTFSIDVTSALILLTLFSPRPMSCLRLLTDSHIRTKYNKKLSSVEIDQRFELLQTRGLIAFS